MEELSQACWSLLFCLKWEALSIDMDGPMGACSMLITVLGIISFSFQFLITLYILVNGYTNGLLKIDWKLVNHGDAIMSLILFCGFVVRRKRIIAELLQILNSIKALGYSPESIKYVRRSSSILAGLGFGIYSATLAINVAKLIFTPTTVIEHCTGEFFGGNVSMFDNPLYDALHYFILEIQFSQFINLVGDFHCILLVFIFSVLQYCYHIFNNAIRSREFLSCSYLYGVQHTHQQIGNMVKQINVLFSPAILFYVAIRALKLVFFLNLSSPSSDASATRDFEVTVTLTYYFLMFKEVVLLLALTISASMIFNKSQSTFDVLLEIYLRNPIIHPEEDANQCKNYHVTTLFVAQQLISPVGISGSNLFLINYGFIFVVISSIITYISLLSSLTSSSPA